MRVAVAQEVETAERWRDALDGAGIDAQVEIADRQTALPGQSPFTGLGGAAPGFAYPVTVPAEDRERAAAILVDHGWDGGSGARGAPGVSTGTRLKGALVAVAIAFAFALLWVWLN